MHINIVADGYSRWKGPPSLSRDFYCVTFKNVDQCGGDLDGWKKKACVGCFQDVRLCANNKRFLVY